MSDLYPLSESWLLDFNPTQSHATLCLLVSPRKSSERFCLHPRVDGTSRSRRWSIPQQRWPHVFIVISPTARTTLSWPLLFVYVGKLRVARISFEECLALRGQVFLASAYTPGRHFGFLPSRVCPFRVTFVLIFGHWVAEESCDLDRPEISGFVVFWLYRCL